MRLFILIAFTFTACTAASMRPEISLDREIDLFSGSEDFLQAANIPALNLEALGGIVVSMYTVHGIPGKDINFRDLGLERILQEKNGNLSWDAIVRVNEDEEKVWVFVGMDLQRQAIAAVAVFQLEGGTMLGSVD